MRRIGASCREEIEVIEPVVRELQREGMRLQGPVPADTAFRAPVLAGTDVVVAMYHDQGLPVLKHVGFGNAVNVTLGLRSCGPAWIMGRAAAGAHRRRRRRQPARRAEPGRGPDQRRRPCRSVSVSASTSCTIRGSSAASSMRSPRFPGPAGRSGPGRGALTWGLLARPDDGRHRDRPRPRRGAGRRFSAGTRLRIHVEMSWRPTSSRWRGGGAPLRIVGNLPITYPPAAVPAPQAAHGDRGHALHAAKGGGGPHGRAAGRQGIRPPDGDAGGLREVQALFDVGPGAFQPPPRVRSAIVRLRPAEHPRFEIGDEGVLRMLTTRPSRSGARPCETA